MSSLDEFIGEGGDDDRAPSLLDLNAGSVKARDWQKRLAEISKATTLPNAIELSLTAFTLIRGGDLFERTGGKPARTPPPLVETYTEQRLKLVPNNTEPLFYWTGLAYLDASIECTLQAPKVTGTFKAAASWTGPEQASTLRAGGDATRVQHAA